MKLICKIGLFLGAMALSCAVASSADLVELRNGSLVRVDHRETRGNSTRLFMDGGSENFVDIATDQIISFEKIEDEKQSDAAPAPTPVPARAQTLEEIVQEACAKYSIDPDIVMSLIRAESSYDPKAVSRKGAQGLMQLMPKTAALLGVDNPMDAASNVDGGTRYLVSLLNEYNRDLTKALAAYNAGPARVDKYHGVPPYRETIMYINRVVRDLYSRKIAKMNHTVQVASKEVKDRTFKP
jgi:hypothetical protein